MVYTLLEDRREKEEDKVGERGGGGAETSTHKTSSCNPTNSCSNNYTYSSMEKTKHFGEDSSSGFSCKFVILALISIILYLSWTVHNLKDYKQNLLRDELFWNKTKANYQSQLNCSASFKLAELRAFNLTSDLQLFVDYLNNHESATFDYFLCFSSLYYAVKIENYDTFRANLSNREQFERKSNFYNLKNIKKCYLESEKINFIENTKRYVDVHLCYLSRNRSQSSDVCRLVDKFNSIYAPTNSKQRQIAKCSYNFVNGEYSVKLKKYIKIVFHEYSSRKYNGESAVWDGFMRSFVVVEI
jgi:hypothetical protein